MSKARNERQEANKEHGLWSAAALLPLF